VPQLPRSFVSIAAAHVFLAAAPAAAGGNEGRLLGFGLGSAGVLNSCMKGNAGTGKRALLSRVISAWCVWLVLCIARAKAAVALGRRGLQPPVPRAEPLTPVQQGNPALPARRWLQLMQAVAERAGRKPIPRN